MPTRNLAVGLEMDVTCPAFKVCLTLRTGSTLVGHRDAMQGEVSATATLKGGAMFDAVKQARRA